jgi:hypothetical protein
MYSGFIYGPDGNDDDIDDLEQNRSEVDSGITSAYRCVEQNMSESATTTEFLYD